MANVQLFQEGVIDGALTLLVAVVESEAGFIAKSLNRYVFSDPLTWLQWSPFMEMSVVADMFQLKLYIFVHYVFTQLMLNTDLTSEHDIGVL